MEGVYSVKVCTVRLENEGLPENENFSKVELGNLIINPEDTGAKLKQQALDLYNEKHTTEQLTLS